MPAISPASRTTPRMARARAQSDADSMLGAQPEQMDGEAADDDAADDSDDDAAGGRGRGPAGRPAAAPRAARSVDTRSRLSRLHPRLRRGSRRRGSVRSRRTRPGCASSSTSNCSICRAWSPSSPTGCSAGCWRSRPAPGISTSRRAAGCRPAGAGGREPDAGAVLQARARHRFPRYRGDAADRQFGLACAAGRLRWRPCAATSWRARWSAAR